MILERSKKVKVKLKTKIHTKKGRSKVRLSDLREQYIKELMSENEDYTEFGRNELAQHFNCVPSQINYVITTRFSPERGYYVESRRGGGGNIKIKRVDITKNKYIMHVINSIDNVITQQEADIIINNLIDYDFISSETAKLMKIATNDKVLNLPLEYKDLTRTRILKNMLINIIN